MATPVTPDTIPSMPAVDAQSSDKTPEKVSKAKAEAALNKTGAKDGRHSGIPLPADGSLVSPKANANTLVVPKHISKSAAASSSTDVSSATQPHGAAVAVVQKKVIKPTRHRVSSFVDSSSAGAHSHSFRFSKERRLWTTEEDAIIRSLVEKHGTKRWSDISDMLRKMLPNNTSNDYPARTGKQCRTR